MIDFLIGLAGGAVVGGSVVAIVMSNIYMKKRNEVIGVLSNNKLDVKTVAKKIRQIYFSI